MFPMEGNGSPNAGNSSPETPPLWLLIVAGGVQLSGPGLAMEPAPLLVATDDDASNSSSPPDGTEEGKAKKH